MIPVQISLDHRKVLIVGGGKVALRKAKLFLSEGANVDVISETIDEQLLEQKINWIHKTYESNDINDYFLVYACTNHKDVNAKIVDDCNSMNVLCGSATYNGDSSFFSMGYQKHDIGTLALSMNQCLPYHKPLLNKMMDVLDENEIRIQKLFELRPFILECADNKKKYFDLLFDCDIKILDFLLKVFSGEQGYIFVYHESDYHDTLTIEFNNSIVLSIAELSTYAYLFLNLNIKIVPLVISLGYIYNKIKGILEKHDINKPLLSDDADIINFIKLYEDEHRDMIYIVHPCANKFVRDGLKKHIRSQDRIVELDEEICLDKNKSYKCVALLLTHGTHFHELSDLFDFKIKEGYNIQYIGCLSDDEKFKNYIINRIM